MKTFSSFIVVFILSSCLAAREREIAHERLSKEDLIVLSETFNLWQKKGEELWSGWTKINMPFVYQKQNYEYYIGFPLPPYNAKLIGKVLGKDVYSVKRKNNLSSAQMDVNGIYAVVLASPDLQEVSKEQWILTAIHEMFHVYQSVNGFISKTKELNLAYSDDASWMLDFPFPYNDANINSLTHIQGFTLYSTITASLFEDKLYNALLLKESISVYKNYIALKYGGEKNYNYSEFQQSMEGVAKYTEIKIAEMAAKDYIPLNKGMDFKYLWNADYSKQLFVVKHCGKGTGGRLTFYYLGYGKCMLLDQLQPDWKEAYFQTFWLDEIMDMSLNQMIKSLRNNN